MEPTRPNSRHPQAHAEQHASVMASPVSMLLKPLTSPYSKNTKIRSFLSSLQRLSPDINIWPHPIGFRNGTQRLNWARTFPYLREYSYFKECFRDKGPGPMWVGLFITAVESWVGKSSLADWHVWAAIIISPDPPATGKRLLIYDCDGPDVDFGSCRAGEALTLPVQRQFWANNDIRFCQLWRSHYDLQTFGRQQCMKNTCEFLINAVRDPPHVEVMSDGREVIRGFSRIIKA
ncbi:hypothetical protein R3P38DRAFT_3223441 [Favolaschia claudopus]|uniref:Uncharacterized protein n=2 Tax=Favolaschia claudopus TaxID=2862362 RepID=A0AAV9ZWL3_9AGAR